MADKKTLTSDISDASLESIVQTATDLPLVDVDDSQRFCDRVRTILGDQVASGMMSKADGPIAVFIMVNRPRQYGAKFKAKSVFDLRCNPIPASGQVFFLNKDASNGYRMALPCEPNALHEWLEDSRLTKCTLAVAHPNKMKVSVRLDGVDGPSDEYTIREKEKDVTEEHLKEALDHFHMRSLLTPTDCHSGIWAKKLSSKYVPTSLAEVSIQKAMVIAMNGNFRQVRVFPENNTQAGRIDIMVQKRLAGTGLVNWAVIELKVLRSFRCTRDGLGKGGGVTRATNISSLVSGFSQADSYRSVSEVDDAYLEIFDMRQDKTDKLENDSKVVEARENCEGEIYCQIRPMFGTVDDARNAGMFRGDS